MPDRIRALLNDIVTHYVVRDEQKDIDLNAPASEPGGELESEKRQAARREVERADELADAFHHGLVLAYRNWTTGAGALALDDRRPAENEIADALIGFLVSYDLAESRSEETEPMHYTYHVTIDWERLGAVADAANIDLRRTLDELSASRR